MINLAGKINKFIDELSLDRKKMMLAVLISAVLVYMDFTLVFKAQLAGFNKASAQVSRLKNDLAGLKAGLRKIEELKSQGALNPQKPILKAKRILPENQIASLLQDISRLANNNDVRVLQIKPFRSPPAGNQDNKIKPAANITPFFIALDLSGGYHHLGKFINGLENLEHLVSAQEIRINRQDGDYLRQRANVTLVTYVKK